MPCKARGNLQGMNASELTARLECIFNYANLYFRNQTLPGCVNSKNSA